jgi:hypothetical protein
MKLSQSERIGTPTKYLNIFTPAPKSSRGAVQRNQLTGSEAFILEIEQRIGERILYRCRGRPRSD